MINMDFTIARVTRVDKNHYLIRDEYSKILAELTGKLMYSIAKLYLLIINQTLDFERSRRSSLWKNTLPVNFFRILEKIFHDIIYDQCIAIEHEEKYILYSVSNSLD